MGNLSGPKDSKAAVKKCIMNGLSTSIAYIEVHTIHTIECKYSSSVSVLG